MNIKSDIFNYIPKFLWEIHQLEQLNTICEYIEEYGQQENGSSCCLGSSYEDIDFIIVVYILAFRRPPQPNN